MRFKDIVLRFFNSFERSKQTNDLSEKQLDSFILRLFNEIIKEDKDKSENFDEIIFLQKFDRELKEKLKLDIVALLGNKVTDKDNSFKEKQIGGLLLNEFNRINKEISDEKFDSLRKSIVDSGSDINAKLKFYYDETNNPRRFWIKQNSFNSPVNKNFILGGLVIDEKKCIGNPEDLKDKLKLQKNIGEIKSKHILKSTFIESLRSKKLNILLKWISENEMYIHFINVDNLHVIVNDILKIIIDKNIDSENIRGSELMHGHTLYKLMSSNIDKVCEILTKYDYPKIHTESITDFCGEWVTFLKPLKSNLPPPSDEFEEFGRVIHYDELWKLFDKVKDGNKFAGLGKDEYIVTDYSNFYLIKPDIFINSFHLFDEELEIEKIINTTSDINFKESRNFAFKDSTEDRFIQISDVVVGLLGRFFSYIEELNGELENGKIVQELIHSISKFDSIQKDNFLLLINILKKSHDKNKLFFYSENTFVQKSNLDFILRITDVSDAMVTFKARV
ncbi:DUF3800 domain-containing protein [Paenibacillus sp. FSL H7-0690]|uniref:DUF3800 domain-containing protein n=1 Tax=Paenibacillus sp. FSL H7-0690 TaxID=2921437 RepID=UPI0030EDFD96